MSAILLLAVSLALGAAMARNPRLPAGVPTGINFWVLEVALPALVLESVPKLRFDPALALPVAAPWIVFLGALLLFPLLGRARGWSRGTVGALILTCGLGNTAFMGLAMIEALRGREALGAAVIADQLGSFLSLSVGGVIVAAVYSGERAHPAEIGRRLFSFAPFLALLAALVLRVIGPLPEALDAVLLRIGQTLAPLALFSVGLQLRLRGVGDQLGKLAAGLGWKLLLAPLLCWLLARALGARGLNVDVAVLQAAMAPMITAGILAETNDLDPPLANLVVGVGILLSLVSVPLAAGWLG